MKIESLTLTKEELNQAVQDYLRWRNINVDVLSVEGRGYPIRGWEVSLDTTDATPTVKSTTPPIKSMEDLIEHIISPTV